MTNFSKYFRTTFLIMKVNWLDGENSTECKIMKIQFIKQQKKVSTLVFWYFKGRKIFSIHPISFWEWYLLASIHNNFLKRHEKKENTTKKAFSKLKYCVDFLVPKLFFAKCAFHIRPSGRFLEKGLPAAVWLSRILCCFTASM